jgi:hypothetical protein
VRRASAFKPNKERHAMAVKRKKAAKKAAKKTRKPAGRKAAARKAPAKKAKPAPKKAKKKSWVAKAVASVSKLVKGKKAKPAKREAGEGNYAATKRFRDKEEAFIKANKKTIPKLAKAAEAALDGPEGNELRAAEASTAARGEGMDIES